MSERDSGGGCAGFILWLFIMWAIAFGLPTPWGTIELDLFPPEVRITGGAK